MKGAAITPFIALALACTACATLTPDKYTHGDDDQATFNKAEASCEMYAQQGRTMNGMGGLAGVASYQDSYNKVFDACMRSHGYAQKP